MTSWSIVFVVRVGADVAEATIEGEQEPSVGCCAGEDGWVLGAVKALAACGGHVAFGDLQLCDGRVESGRCSSSLTLTGPRMLRGCWHRTAAPELTMAYQRITTDPAQMAGQPCIRGLRIRVATILAMLADGMDVAEILEAYPDLEAADINEALHYAAEALRERELPLRESA